MSALVNSAVRILAGWFLAGALVGNAGAQSALTFQGAAEQSTSPVERDAFGKPCLEIRALARASTINRDIIDHVVWLQNKCPKKLTVKVCYYNSERCNRVEAAPYKRTDTILGTVNGVRFFRYNVTELNVSQPNGLTKEFTNRSLR